MHYLLMLFLMSASFAQTSAEWEKNFDERNLSRDKNKTRNDWRSRFPIKEKKVHQISGRRTFYSLFVRKYRYELIEDPRFNQIVAKVKIHFYPSKSYLRRSKRLHAENHEDKKYYPLEHHLMAQIRHKLMQAEILWKSQAPANVDFEFEMVDNAKDAHYSLKLTNMFGALYDTFIWSGTPSDILAHEIGHMMGLDDEYSPFTSNVFPIHEWTNSLLNKNETFEQSTVKDMKCNLESLMCLKETLYPYHFEHILGRIPN